MKLSEEIKTAIGFLEDDAQRGRLSCKIKAEHFLELLPKVEQLEQQNNELLETIINLKTGDCFCQCGIDNPMMSKHSLLCKNTIDLIEKTKGQKWSDIIKG